MNLSSLKLALLRSSSLFVQAGSLVEIPSRAKNFTKKTGFEIGMREGHESSLAMKLHENALYDAMKHIKKSIYELKDMCKQLIYSNSMPKDLYAL